MVDDREQFERETRALFHSLHSAQAKDDYIFHRLTSLLSTDYLQVPGDFFHGKRCLDAGCGSNANATFAMLELGASKVNAFDLDDTIFETAPLMLEKFARDRYRITTGNVLDISFDDNTFDFVHCGGVLHHSADVLKGLRELARVTRPGGMLYIHTYGKGGLVRELTSLFREKYQNDAGFKKLINELDVDSLRQTLSIIFTSMEQHGDTYGSKISDGLLYELVDDDLVLTIKDRIAAPAYHEHDEQELRSCLEAEGFSEIQRLKRYPYLKNLRRFLSPLYHDYDSPAAEVLYGSGIIQLKAIKLI